MKGWALEPGGRESASEINVQVEQRTMENEKARGQIPRKDWMPGEGLWAIQKPAAHGL